MKEVNFYHSQEQAKTAAEKLATQDNTAVIKKSSHQCQCGESFAYDVHAGEDFSKEYVFAVCENCASEYKLFDTAEQLGRTEGFYDYEHCFGDDEVINRCYEYATEVLRLPSGLNIDIGDDGQEITRISAVLPNNMAYEFSSLERSAALAYNLEIEED